MTPQPGTAGIEVAGVDRHLAGRAHEEEGFLVIGGPRFGGRLHGQFTVNFTPDGAGIVSVSGQGDAGSGNLAPQIGVAWVREIAQDTVYLVPLTIKGQTSQPGDAR